MQNTNKTKNLAIIWNHNEDNHPFWLDAITRAGGIVGWDVGWKTKSNQFMVVYS